MAVVPRILGRAALDLSPYPVQTCSALFDAILIDDVVDDHIEPPDAVPLDHAQRELVACFRLSRQLWIEGYDRARLIRCATTLRKERDLDPDDRLLFKHVRAKFKHVRYAHALYGASHHYPPLLNCVTVTMGLVQDAYRTGACGTVAAMAALLRALLSGPFAARLRAESDRLVPTTPAAFRAHLEAGRVLLERLIAQPTATGPVFHAARKVIGRQVSFWDTLRTLQPSPERVRISRWLSAINGQMGSLHDQLVERRADDRSSYRAAFAIPDEVRDRVAVLTDRMRAAPTG